MSKVFEIPYKIRFSECDSTGLVFHSHFFKWAVDTEEEFFLSNCGTQVFGPGAAGGYYTPMAGVRAEFISPLRAGDYVTFQLWIEKLGWSSIRWGFVILKDGKTAIKIAETLVFTKIEPDGSFKAAEIPSAFREAMLPYVKEPGVPGMAFRS
ncbi:MAG: thioesterase family protein [Sutterellaceae bacterium]|nr:thioesterase family protein [Sutterellaceae bacterium]MDY2867899.1 thioesterase family protein [Mesosutterella sp.]